MLVNPWHEAFEIRIQIRSVSSGEEGSPMDSITHGSLSHRHRHRSAPFVRQPELWKKQQITPFDRSGACFPALESLALNQPARA